MDEELSYVSSSPLLATRKKDVKLQDEVDFPTLLKIGEMLSAQIESYATTDRLTIDETNFTVKEQLAINKAISMHLTELKATVDSGIKNVKEKYE